jgi:hypothetical protein
MNDLPEKQRLEQLLRSSRLVAGGFMGRDKRGVSEIIEADCAELSRFGVTKEQLAARMHQITATAALGLGTWVRIDEQTDARVVEARGSLVCPWPHPGRYLKRVTIVKDLESGLSICWSDLNIHQIGEHGFFEGKGSEFRIEPGEIVRQIL